MAPQAPNDPPPFPGERDLCESCGYPLKGLAPEGDCPECGSTAADSHPSQRTGPAFHRRPGLTGYTRTLIEIARHPKRTNRAMAMDGPNTPARLFLLVTTALAAVLWTLTSAPAIDELFQMPPELDLNMSGVLGLPFVLVALVVLTYIEVLGVTWFSRKRGWRVPLRQAERVACYASVGWLPGAVLFGVVLNLAWAGVLEDHWATLGGDPVYGPDAAWAATFLAAVLAMLGFETLVWVGVRQVKHANTLGSARAPHAATRPGASENAAPGPPA